MRSFGALVRVVQQHPWTSLQDAALVGATVLVCLLLAFEYDIVQFWDELTPEQRRLRMEEMFVITGVLAGGLVLFVLRRMHEERADLERRIRAEYEARESRALAMQDPLTALPNRRELEVALEAAIGDARPGRAVLAFYLLDLNGFKGVNDLHGHAAGDEVLRSVAQRLRSAARKGDLVARLGGDEFAVLAPDIEGREKAAEIGDRLVASLKNAIQLGEHSFPIGVSIGVALYPEHGRTAALLMHHADLAMYRAKAGGTSQWQFYQEAEAERRMA